MLVDSLANKTLYVPHGTIIRNIMKNKRKLNYKLSYFLNCVDYNITKEAYKLMYNEEYNMLITSPVPDSFEKYYSSEEYISHTDRKKTLIDKAYHLAKKYTLKRKLSLINSFKYERKNLLDIGAGTGDFLSISELDNWNILGVEPNKNARKIAKDKGIKLIESIYKIKNKTFDIITLWHTLEHIKELEEYIYEIKKLLSKNGRVIIAVPNYKSYDAKYYKNYWAAYDVPRHLWHFSQSSINKIFKEENMTVEKTLPMKLDAYYVSLLSEKYKSGSINYFKAMLIGFISNFKARKTSEYSSLIYIIKKIH